MDIATGITIGGTGDICRTLSRPGRNMGVESLQLWGVRTLPPWVFSPSVFRLPYAFEPGVPEPLPQDHRGFSTLPGWATSPWLSP